jgi:DNA-binding PucR family transcriptional regulator
MRRIESLLGLDLGQPQSLLQVQLALIVDEIVATKREIDDGRG